MAYSHMGAANYNLIFLLLLTDSEYFWHLKGFFIFYFCAQVYRLPPFP